MKITIDDIQHEVDAGKNLLESIIALGLDLPYFCYHPAMGSVGACRQCAVKKYANADDKKGRIIMACMEPVSEGMIISIKDEESRQFRAGIIEGLMTNHPHDCPICDEGGECHLQDMTVMTGHNYRKFDFKKRTFKSQYLGPFIHHEMNRCIQCYRCVRFYRDYAGGDDLNVFGTSNKLFFGRAENGVLQNEFSGNLIEVCPTGVFTDKTLQKHYTRKWDLSNGPSVCVHCSLGCNTLVGERYGELRRVMSRYHGEINGYFLCDRGRFGYEFVNHPSRLKEVVRPGSDAVIAATDKLQDFLSGTTRSNTRIIGIGSPRASLESNFALQALVGKDNFYNGLSHRESRLLQRSLKLLNSVSVNAVSLKEIEKCDAAFVIGEDITQTAPVMALSLRQMTRTRALNLANKAGIPEWNDAAARELAQNEKSPLYIAHPYPTRLDDVARAVFNNSPGAIADLGFAVASVISDNTGANPRINQETEILARQIASDLLNAENPLLIAGISGATEPIFNALNNIIAALSLKNKKPSLAIAFPESNSAGITLFNSGDLKDAINRISVSGTDILIILENDIYRRLSAGDAEKLLERSGKVIVIDHLMHKTAAKADIVLPAAVWAESTGTIVNNEFRAQRYYPALPVQSPVKESWQWINDILNITGKAENHHYVIDDLIRMMINQYPVFSGITAIPDSGFRIYNEKIARQTLRFSGRTAITANISVSEPALPADYNAPLKFSMEGYQGNPPASLIPYYWWPGWNSPQAINKYLGEPNGPVKDGNPGVSLLQGNVDPVNKFITDYSEPLSRESGELLIIPVPVIFGSEELSALGGAISSLIPSPFVLLNEDEAAAHQVSKGDSVTLKIGDSFHTVIIKTDNKISVGMAGISMLLPGMKYIEFPATGKIIKGV